MRATTSRTLARLLVGLLVLTATLSHAQDERAATITLQGRVIDVLTGRPIADANVRLMHRAHPERRMQTDATGAFSFEDAPEGVYSIEADAAGYRNAVQTGVRIVLRKVAHVELALARTGERAVEEVVVTARAVAQDAALASNVVELDREEIRRNPGSAGDVFRALDVLPGVVATGEFSNFTVRGNGPQDNLILVDGIPFDKVVHFDQSLGEQEDIGGGGRFSIFAPNLIGAARFSAGGWRAAEGGRNGSLVELDVADGNPVSSTVGARVDITGAELDYDGPSYVASNTSVLVSARRYDFGNLFEAIDEADIGTPRLADVIFKSVTEVSPTHAFEVLAIHATEDYTRTVENALASPDFEDVTLVESEQDSSLFGLTWRWSPGDVARIRNTFYLRNSNKLSTQGEAFPDLAGASPTPETTPTRPEILTIAERERELGWRGDFASVLTSGNTVTAGVRVTRVNLDFDRRLAGDWIRYVYDASDFRPDPAQRHIVLTPEQTNAVLDAEATQLAAYADYSHALGDMTLTPGVRYERDGFSGRSSFAPRLAVHLESRRRHERVGGRRRVLPGAALSRSLC